MSNSNVSEAAIVIERIFDAPVELIWQMWTQPEHLQHWYGPDGARVPVAEMDVRVGGRRLVCMEVQTPDGLMKLWTTGEFLEVVANQRLVYTDSPADEHGNLVAHGESFVTTEVTVLLEDLNGRTKMIMKHAGLPEGEQGANAAWKQAFAKMAEHVKSLVSRK